MPYVDRPLPEGLQLPKLQHRGTQNLVHEGRVPGAVNRISKDLKTGIVNGAAAHGADGKGKDGLEGYLCMCATRYPKHYMMLLSKLLPLQVNGDGLPRQHINTVNVISIPSGEFLSQEDMEKMRAPSQYIEEAPFNPAEQER